MSDMLKVELLGACMAASMVVWMAARKDEKMDLKMVALMVVRMAAARVVNAVVSMV